MWVECQLSHSSENIQCIYAFGLKRNHVSVKLIFLFCLVLLCFAFIFLFVCLLSLWLWCYHWCYIAASKGQTSLRAASCECPWSKVHMHRISLILACHTSSCTLARNKTDPASNFLAFVHINRIAILFWIGCLHLQFFQWCYERILATFRDITSRGK